ncbi:MAG TPA: DinB family protein, partial [Planctomycetota bacterium]|nr:DinB family protein [Planctomycetota bacterium]
TGQPFALRLGDSLLHVADHGVHHRAQAIAMLRAVGRKAPIGIDYLFFRGERPTLAWPERMKRQWRELGFPVPDAVEAPARFDLDTLREYLRFSDWATRRVIEASPLSDAQLDRPFPIGLKTLRRTLTHLRDAEQWWFQNWTGIGDGSFAHLPETTGLGELTRLLDASIAARDAYLDGCDDARLLTTVTVEPVPGAPLTFRIGETVMQLPAHGTHHRAQALAMLRALGADPPRISYAAYAQLHDDG